MLGLECVHLISPLSSMKYEHNVDFSGGTSLRTRSLLHCRRHEDLLDLAAIGVRFPIERRDGFGSCAGVTADELSRCDLHAFGRDRRVQHERPVAERGHHERAADPTAFQRSRPHCNCNCGCSSVRCLNGRKVNRMTETAHSPTRRAGPRARCAGLGAVDAPLQQDTARLSGARCLIYRMHL